MQKTATSPVDPSHPLLLLSAIAAAAYWLLHALPVNALGLPCKVGAIVALLFWARSRLGGGVPLVLAALAAHAAGDGLLEWGRLTGNDVFLPAVAAFLVGHLINLSLFIPLSAQRWAYPRLAIGLIVLSAVVGYLVLHGLWQGQAPALLQVAVPVYMTVLLVMALAAQRVAAPRIAAGAACYLVSDGLIGLDRFAGLFAHLGFGSGWLTWPSYYAGQWLLVTGLVTALSPATRNTEELVWTPR